jgi:hypothetical protein
LIPTEIDSADMHGVRALEPALDEEGHDVDVVALLLINPIKLALGTIEDEDVKITHGAEHSPIADSRSGCSP